MRTITLTEDQVRIIREMLEVNIETYEDCGEAIFDIEITKQIMERLDEEV